MKRNNIKNSASDMTLNTVVTTIMVLFLTIIMYPLIYVLSSSFSSGAAVTTGKVLLWPVEFCITGYEVVFANKAVWRGYGNTLFYTILGTAFNVVLTTLAAYPLSRKNFRGRGLYMALFMIPMFFTGGMIPTYLLMSNLHLVNTRWALVVIGGISTYNMIVMRTFFQNSIPGELLEAAKIDGITDIGYLMKIVLPLSKAIIAVISLYYSVTHWNTYFNGLLYLRKRELYPLQMVLREILNASKITATDIDDLEALAKIQEAADVMKYALIVVSVVPMLILYPFIQKFFEKGVMVGSVKG